MIRRTPKLRIITHHLGAMAPFLVNRIGYGMDQFGTRTTDEDYEGLRKRRRLCSSECVAPIARR